jgi:hypothetical protein
MQSYLSKKFVHFAAAAVIQQCSFRFALLVIVFVAQKIVTKERIVHQTLQHHVQETCLPKI